jgi:DNA-binding response OmpR family regulator
MVQETILVIEDEPAIVQVIEERLARDGFEVRSATSGEDGLAAFAGDPPDLLILDLMLPGVHGFDVLRRLRQEGYETPVIVLTARDDDVDVVVGLELGADDYVLKPFNPRELAARVRALLRRRAEALLLAGRVADLEARLASAAGQLAPEAPTTGLHFDAAARRAWFEGHLLELRPREYDLLHFLAQNPGRVHTRASLLDQVWGVDEYIAERTVDVHIHRLREKLAEVDPQADPIQTERGIGYRFQT